MYYVLYILFFFSDCTERAELLQQQHLGDIGLWQTPSTLLSSISKATCEHFVHLAHFYCTRVPFLSVRWRVVNQIPRMCSSAEGKDESWCSLVHSLFLLQDEWAPHLPLSVIHCSYLEFQGVPSKFVSLSDTCTSVVVLISLQIDQKTVRAHREKHESCKSYFYKARCESALHNFFC